MRYYIISGEASGDLHGANLIRALHRRDAAAEVRAWGGDLMATAGATLVRHYRDLAFMGFVEVLRHLGTILRNLKFCKQDILSFRPDVLVLIDYPGFNLRIATWAKQQGLRVVYYISPQVWAWKEGRVKTIRNSVDQMLVILPFEKAFYAKHDFKVSYVGHPLLERMREEQEKPLRPLSSDQPVVALLPGSRAMEIRRKLPVMLQAAKQFPGYQFVVAGAPAQPDALYEQYIGDASVLLLRNDTYNLLRQARAAMVTSGTATLETALLGVPQVVCYSGNPLSVWLARRWVKVPFISLVNLIMGREVVRELIQDELNESSLGKELHSLLEDEGRRRRMAADYQALWVLLEDGGSASEKAAADIVMQAQKRQAG